MHEFHRVPKVLGFTPDGDLFMLPIAVGLVIWWSRSHLRPAAGALAAYALVNLLGGLLSVLPLANVRLRPQKEERLW